jgi:PAS domain S-box-containing protein
MPQKGRTSGNRAAPARAAATVTMLFGLVALAGWAFHIPALTCVLPGAVEMKANTAVALILCGVALLISADRTAVSMGRIATGSALAAAAIGLATLAEYLFGWQLGMDELLVKDTDVAYNVFRGRMSPLSAAAFVVIGSALAAMRRDSLLNAAKSAAGGVILIGAVCIVGYLWNAGELITDRWLPPVAINTAVCFVLLGAGILLSPDRSGAGLDMQLSDLATVEIKILSGFLLAISLLLFGGSYTYRTSVELADSVDWVAHTQEVRAILANLYGSLAGAELAQRDYLLTARHVRLDEYVRLVKIVQDHLAELGRLTRDNPAQQRDWAALKSAVQNRLDDMAGAGAAYQTYGLPAARAVLGQGGLSSGTEDVRVITERMDAVEVRLLAERRTAAENVRRATLISLLVTLALASGIFMVLFREIHREMRARRDAEHALRSSEQYNRSIVDSSPDCLAVLTADARLTQMTAQGLRLMEVGDFGSIADADWFEFWSGEDQAAARRAVAAALGGSAGRFQGTCPTRAGTPKWWDVIVMPIPGGDGKTGRLLSVARDITEVKRAEAKLTAANRFLDSLIESLPVMIFVKDARTLCYVRQNRATLNLLGLSRDDVIGKRDHDFLPSEQADSILAKDREVLAAGRLVDIPEQSIHTRLLGVRTLHTMKMPILDEHGTPEFLLGISEDITERKLAEHAIRELNAALLAKAAQLEATNKELESFSYSVSHDLRAPLRAIDGFALMLMEDYAERLDAEGLRYLSVVRQNSRRMGALIDDLLTFSRLGRQAVAHTEVNVDSLVREVVEEVLHTESLGGRSEAATAPHIEVEPLPAARGDRGLLRQVWANLIANAVKYSSKASRPFIQVSGRQVGAESHYSIRDNGVGFSMEYAGQLFRVFQRLHRADEFSGTGVGLAIVHRVVTRHGGRVWAEGKVDHGAVFSFALPRGDPSG